MNNRKYKVLHQHLIKCGGTTLNGFISTKYPANRVLDPASIPHWLDSIKAGLKDQKKTTSDLAEYLAVFRFAHYDSVFGHNPLFWTAPDDFFNVTVLRDPTTRVRSQIKDWQRLTDADIKRGKEETQEFKRYAQKANELSVLKMWNTAGIARRNLANMQTRLLGLSLIGPQKYREDWSTNEGLRLAYDALQAYDLVGITEDLDTVTRALSYKMGWCPPRGLFAMNRVSTGSQISPEFEELAASLNKNDQFLYEEAIKYNEQNKQFSGYDTETFEESFAAERVKALSPVFIGEREFRFDFNMPIIGNGFWPRDAANTPECAVWTGPGNISTLFMPTIPMAKMTIQIGVKGYAQEEIREGLKVYVDGYITPHTFSAREGLRDMIEVNWQPTRNFIRVDLEAPFTITDAVDPRERGVSLIFYGYELLGS